MSAVIHPEQFKTNVKPVDDLTQARLQFAIQLMAGAVPLENIEDLEDFARTALQLRDALDSLLDAVAFELRYRGTSDFDVKKFLQATCPMLAALYRIEALAGHRISNDQHAYAKLAEVRELAMQAVEERFGGEFENPIYPAPEGAGSEAAKWKRLQEQTS